MLNRPTIGIALVEPNPISAGMITAMVMKSSNRITRLFSHPRELFIPGGIPLDTDLILYNGDLNPSGLKEDFHRLRGILPSLQIIAYFRDPRPFFREATTAGAAAVPAARDLLFFFDRNMEAVLFKLS